MELVFPWARGPRARSHGSKTMSGAEGVCKEDKTRVPGQSDQVALGGGGVRKGALRRWLPSSEG